MCAPSGRGGASWFMAMVIVTSFLDSTGMATPPMAMANPNTVGIAPIIGEALSERNPIQAQDTPSRTHPMPMKIRAMERRAMRNPTACHRTSPHICFRCHVTNG